MREMFVTNGAARLRVRDAGDGPAVFFIHGWALDLEMWTPQLEELSRDHRTIAFDRRGFGMSTGEANTATDVEDLRCLFDRLKVSAAGIVGMSQGARVAARFAHDYAQQVHWLVLDGAPSMQSEDANESLEIPLDYYRERLTRAGVESFRREWSAHPLMRLHTQDPRMRTLLRTIIGRYSGIDLRAPRDSGPIDVDLHALTTRVLVINGEFDTSARHAAGEQIARTIRGAQRAIIPNAGHLSNLDSPAIYNHVIRAFEREYSTAPQQQSTA